MISDAEKKARERLERQCARAEYCTADMRRKALKLLEGDEEAAARVVDGLVREGFVDDRRYAGAFVREKSSLQGWGEAKLRYMLSTKGIDREVIADALTEIDPEKAAARLDKLVSAKARTLEGDPAARLKLLKFALSRGYDYPSADRAVKAVLSGE